MSEERGVQAPKVEVRVGERGFIREAVVDVLTPYGEIIASVAVSSRRGFNERFADHEVTFSTRVNLESPACLEGGSSFVSVPLSSGEQEAVREGRFP